MSPDSMTASHGSGNLNSVSMATLDATQLESRQYPQRAVAFCSTRVGDLASEWSARGPFRTRTGGGRAGALYWSTPEHATWRENQSCGQTPTALCQAEARRERSTAQTSRPQKHTPPIRTHALSKISPALWLVDAWGCLRSEASKGVGLRFAEEIKRAWIYRSIYAHTETRTARAHVCRDDWSLEWGAAVSLDERMRRLWFAQITPRN